MRQLILDTETTGLELSQGHRIIEIGCVELMHRRPTGSNWHRYLSPGRDVEAAALAVHGITNDFLASQPAFSDVVDEFLAFVEGAELVIHNADFDVAFLDAELAAAGRTTRMADHCRITDTLALARRLHPGQRNNLDALCRRYGVDNNGRDLHGALLDARLLAEVYLAMSGGQAALGLDAVPASERQATAALPTARGKIRIRVVRADEAELAAHERSLEAIERASGGPALFRGGAARGA